MKTMLLTAALAALCISATSCGTAEKTLGELFPAQGGLTQADAAAGIKEALLKGTTEGVDRISKVDGFFGNPEIKIPFPPDATAMETKLRAIGLGDQVDKVVVTINHAAENAAHDAEPIFSNAIRKMTIGDAISIVRGDSTAATRYLQKNTYDSLTQMFQPSIKTSLDKVNATKYWQDVITTYNALPFVTKINPDLTQYVTGKAVDGLFVMIAKEESLIRKDPLARTTDLLKKVFGQQ